MASIGDLVVNLKATSAPMRAGLEGGRSLLSSFVSSIPSMLGPVAGAFAGAFSIGHAIEAAGGRAKAEKLLASTVAATGGAAGFTTTQLVEYAQELQRTTNFSAEATIGAEKMLLTFRNVKGDTFKQATKAAQDMATVLGMDLSQASRVVGRALNDPANSLKLLRKAGVQFTDAQKAQIAQMQAAGDMAGAQKVILDGLSGSFGGAAENMASPVAQLKNTVNELAEDFGMLFGPSIKAVADAFNTMLGPLEETRGSFQAFGKMVADFIGVILKPFGQAIGQTAQLLMGMWAGGSVSAADFGNVAKLAMDNMTLGMMKLLPNGEQIFTDLGITIAAVWDGIGAAASAVWDDLKSGFQSVVNFVSTRAQALWAAVKAGVSGENPIDAYNASLAEALKNVTEPAKYKGPIDEFWKSFNQTAANATEGLKEQGGLTKVLTVDRDKLAKDVKSTIDSLPKLPGINVPEFKKRTPVDAGTGGAAKKQGKPEKDEKLQAFEARSKEALEDLAKSIRGDKGPEERTADAAERTADATERLADNDENDDDQPFDLTGGGVS